MHPEIRVYTASKKTHAAKLKDFRSKVDGIYFTARWPITCLIEDEKVKPARHWQQDNIDDIIRSDAILVYVESGEHLKGGLVEIGIAIAHGKPVFLVGEHADYSKWQYLPRVYRNMKTLEEAIDRIKVHFRGKPGQNNIPV